MTTALARMNIKINDIADPQYIYAIQELTSLVNRAFRQYDMEDRLRERLSQTIADNMYEHKLLTKAERGGPEAYNLTFNNIRQLITTILRETAGLSIAKNSEDNADTEQNSMIVSAIDKICAIRVQLYKKAPYTATGAGLGCHCCDGRSCGYVRSA